MSEPAGVEKDLVIAGVYDAASGYPPPARVSVLAFSQGAQQEVVSGSSETLFEVYLIYIIKVAY